MGFMSVPDAVEDFQPDVVYHTGEPGTATQFTKVVKSQIPFLAYIPIEGEPLVEPDWRATLAGVNFFTCSQYGADIVKRDLGIDVPWAYHGIDHDTFKVNGRRDEVRDMLGWRNKFVVICVATNVRRKQWPRLFEAVSILKHHYKQKDIVLYAHTVPFDGYWLEGWKLPVISHTYGVYNEVIFNPALVKHNDAISDRDFSELPSLVDMYNAADLFVLPSQVEGFGLPIAEAMACGVPVIVTRYGAGWEVASPAGFGVRPRDWEIHKSGTKYANIDPLDLAKQMLDLKRNPNKRAKVTAKGLERVKDFTWDRYRELLLDGIRTATPVAGAKVLNETSESAYTPSSSEQETTSASASPIR